MRSSSRIIRAGHTKSASFQIPIPSARACKLHPRLNYSTPRAGHVLHLRAGSSDTPSARFQGSSYMHTSEHASNTAARNPPLCLGNIFLPHFTFRPASRPHQRPPPSPPPTSSRSLALARFRIATGPQWCTANERQYASGAHPGGQRDGVSGREAQDLLEPFGLD